MNNSSKINKTARTAAQPNEKEKKIIKPVCKRTDQNH